MRNLLLGIRFALTADRSSWIRALLAAVGVAVCLFTLLSLAAADSAMSARSERLQARSPVPAQGGAEAGGRSRQPHVLVRQGEDFADGRTVTRILVDTSSFKATSVAPPPGLSHLPEPGRCAVSPELHALMKADDGKAGKALRERYCGGRADVVQRQGLLGPDELLAYVGVDGLRGKPADVGADTDSSTDSVVAFGNSGAADGLSGSGVLVSGGQMLALAALALCVPLAVLVSACARMTSRARERRLAALRLAGASRRQGSVVLAGETLVPVLLGCALAWLAFAVSRPLSGGLRIAGYGWYPADLRPGVLGVLACLLLIVVSVAVARRAGDRALRSPYGSRQMAQAPRAKKWGLFPLLSGWLVLAVVSVRGVPPEDSELWAMVLYAAMVLCLLGLPTTLPLLTRGSARGLAVRTRRLPLQLAARRLAHGAGETSRAATTLAVGCVALVSAILLLSIFTQAGTSDPRAALRTPEGRAVVADLPSSAVLAAQHRLRDVEGVRTVVPLRKLEPPASGDELGSSVLVADCEQLREIWDRPLRGCAAGNRSGPSARIAHSGAAETQPGERVSVAYGAAEHAGAEAPVLSFRAPHRTVDLPETWGELASWDAQVLLSPHAPALAGRGPAPVRQLFVFTDGSSAAEQRVRAALMSADPRATLTSSAGDVANGTAETAPQTAAVAGAALATAAALLLAMAITGIDTAAGRRRNTSALVVTGAHVQTLRRAQLWYLALPMLWSTACVTITGLLLNTVFDRITDAPLRLNSQVVEVIAGTSAAGLALCLPIALIVGGRRPDLSALRTE